MIRMGLIHDRTAIEQRARTMRTSAHARRTMLVLMIELRFQSKLICRSYCLQARR